MAKKTAVSVKRLFEYLLYGVIFASVSMVASLFTKNHSYVVPRASADVPATSYDSLDSWYTSDGDSGSGGACDGSAGADDGCSEGAP